MTLSALRDDALSTTNEGFALRLSLPWIRSLPLSSLTDLVVEVDSNQHSIAVRLGDRTVAPAALATESAWWFVQDRVELRSPGPLAPGFHDVSVSFSLTVPYLQTGPDGPLRLPFHTTRTLRTDVAATAPSVSLDVA
jgi:hypothetical protein